MYMYIDSLLAKDKERERKRERERETERERECCAVYAIEHQCHKFSSSMLAVAKMSAVSASI